MPYKMCTHNWCWQIPPLEMYGCVGGKINSVRYCFSNNLYTNLDSEFIPVLSFEFSRDHDKT